MIDSKLRKNVQPAFDAIAGLFIKLKITPNQITVGAFLIGLLSALMIGLKLPLLAITFLWFSGLLDVLDGTVARITKNSSKSGAYMDLTLDRMVEASIILALFHAFPQHVWMYLLFFVAVLFNFTTFIVAGALFENESKKGMHYDVGIAERTETFIAFTLLILLPKFIFGILLIFNGIVFLTGVIRFYKVLKFTKSEGL